MKDHYGRCAKCDKPGTTCTCSIPAFPCIGGCKDARGTAVKVTVPRTRCANCLRLGGQILSCPKCNFFMLSPDMCPRCNQPPPPPPPPPKKCDSCDARSPETARDAIEGALPPLCRECTNDLLQGGTYCTRCKSAAIIPVGRECADIRCARCPEETCRRYLDSVTTEVDFPYCSKDHRHKDIYGA